MSLVRTQAPVLVVEVHVDYSTHGLQAMEDIVLSDGNRWQCREACIVGSSPTACQTGRCTLIGKAAYRSCLTQYNGSLA